MISPWFFDGWCSIVEVVVEILETVEIRVEIESAPRNSSSSSSSIDDAAAFVAQRCFIY